MARLIDRILAHGTAPATVASLTGTIDPQVVEGLLAAQLADRDLTAEELKKLADWSAANPPPVGPEFDVDDLVGIPVIVADDVARYTGALGRVNIADEVATMAPPFERFWLDIDGAPDPTGTGLRAWGWLVETGDPAEIGYEGDTTEDGPRWVLRLTLFLERTKQHPIGPVAIHIVGLAEDGTLYRHPDGETVWASKLALREGEASPDRADFDMLSEYWVRLVFPALLAISFLHCTNVATTVVTPPPKLSAKHRKRHGLPLVRYLMLEIDAFRELLRGAGGTDGPGLRAALHLCRGHFKVYGPDAPLFGRMTGTWWWAPQVRGHTDAGIVAKDYRVAAPRVGRAWKDLGTDMPARPGPADPDDPDRWGNGFVTHNETVNALAAAISAAGLAPLRAGPHEPDYDLAFLRGDELVVIEVKSLTESNEEHQLRQGLGQIARYRQLLAADGHDEITPVLAGSRAPTDPTWAPFTEQLDGILVVAPHDWNDRLHLKQA